MNMQGMKLISPAVQRTSFLCVRRLRLIGDHNGLLRSFLATVFSTHLLITLLIHLPLGRGNKRIIVAVPIVLGVALVLLLFLLAVIGLLLIVLFIILLQQKIRTLHKQCKQNKRITSVLEEKSLS